MPKVKSEQTKRLEAQAAKIKAWIVDVCDLDNAKHREALGRMLVCIYNRQTFDERDAERTKHHNKVGFMGAHGEVGTSIAKQYLEKGTLTWKQWDFVRRMMQKYTKQLAEDYFRRNPPELIRTQPVDWKEGLD